MNKYEIVGSTLLAGAMALGPCGDRAASRDAELLLGNNTERSTLEYIAEPDSVPFNPEQLSGASYANCDKTPDTWARNVDDGQRNEKMFYIGVLNGDGPSGENQIFRSGATISYLGNFVYDIATPEHDHGQSEIVDLKEGDVALVLEGTEEYGVLFSARLGQDNSAYFSIDCLRNYASVKSESQVPLLPETVPEIETDSRPEHYEA